MTEFRLRWAAPGVIEALEAEPRVAAVAITTAVKAAAEGMKLAFRQDIARAGLGTRLGNAVRSTVYPLRGASIGAAAVIAPRANAANILSVFQDGATIRGRGGGWLAIPSKFVPSIDAGGRPMSPAQVEAHFRTPLDYIPNPGGAPVLVMDLIAAQRAGAGFRPATRRRRAAARPVRRVLMFTLVPMVTLNPVLRLRAIAEEWSRAIPGLIDRASPQRGR